MAYIIVWNNNSRDPFIQTDSHYFAEEFETLQDAQDAAEANLDDEHFKYYKIYKEATS